MSSTPHVEEERWDRNRARQIFARFSVVRGDRSLDAGPNNVGESEYDRLRNELVVVHLNLVRYLAVKFANRGEALDDLIQVGTVGLLKAIDRFDLSRGVELTTYATPNIVGEIKRYFRDKGWSVRVPRGLQELNIRLNKVIDELVPKLQRSPTISELAEAANATPEEVLEALETSQAYNSVSLQASPNGEGGEEDA